MESASVTPDSNTTDPLPDELELDLLEQVAGGEPVVNISFNDQNAMVNPYPFRINP